MACRLINLSKHPLRIDLFGGETLQLQPGEASTPVRDELLYHNMYVSEWERAGLLARQPMKFEELLEYEAGRNAPPAGKEADAPALPDAKPASARGAKKSK